jgi:hypothetical protein
MGSHHLTQDEYARGNTHHDLDNANSIDSPVISRFATAGQLHTLAARREGDVNTVKALQHAWG